jgi:hypothetical protein
MPTPPSKVRASMPIDPDLQQIAAADWADVPEATLCSELITPVLMALGYGQHTLHKVAQQQTYKLEDPEIQKGSRGIRLDYQPRVYEEGLWVMEAKGTDAAVSPKTLGQVRDYAIHPEIRAPLMVTVDRAGFQIFDPWDEHWSTPLLIVPLGEVATRIDELRAILGTDRVADFVRRRQFDHLRRALSASLEFGVLSDAEGEFRQLIDEARRSIDAKRMAIYEKSQDEAEALYTRNLETGGVSAAVRLHNGAWANSQRSTQDLAKAVLAQDERERATQMMQIKPTVEAMFKRRCPQGAPLYRPLWWLHVVVLASSVALRGEAGCEPYAKEIARQAIRDTLLGFPDDDVAAASWQFQRTFIPVTARVLACFPLNNLSGAIRSRMSPEDRIRLPVDPARLLMFWVTEETIRKVSEIDPWDAPTLERETLVAAETLRRLSNPQGEWIGPMTDPWLKTWETVDHLQMCALSVLEQDSRADDLLLKDEIKSAILTAARSEHKVVSRVAIPLATRLGLEHRR